MSAWVERPTIELDGSQPWDRRFESVPTAAIENARELLSEIRKQLPSQLGWLANAVRLRTAGRFHAEMKALAAMADTTWQEIAVANVTYDLTLAIGCTTVALPTREGPVLARNMDWWPEDLLARSSYLLSSFVDGGLRMANAGWPGAVGVVTGLSGNGFAVALNAVDSEDGREFTGYPVLLHIRRVLEDAGGFDEAVETLQRTKLTTSALFTVVGRENDQRVVIERSARKSSLRWAEPGRPLAATNHYRQLFCDETTHETNELFGTSCGRYESVLRAFDDLDPNESISDERLLYVLTEPSVILGITAQHIVMRPRLNSIRLFVPRKHVE